LTIEPRIDALRVPEAEFISFLKLSFGQKRKTLWNNLKTQYDQEALRAALSKSGVKPTVRAEALPLTKSATLFRALQDGSR
jgi:16S rRNA (adenine1518-N6/adenine1519-N6)-dimethyltransferase